MTSYITQKELDVSLDNLAVKLIKHINQQSVELKKDIGKIDDKYDHLITTLDAFLKRLDDMEANDAARDMQLARHDRWFEEIASKVGVKLTY